VVVSQLDATHISERIEHHAYGRNFGVPFWAIAAHIVNKVFDWRC
jgi:hypothetical protein